MSDEALTEEVHAPGPSEVRDPAVRAEFKRAGVWFALAAAAALIILLIQPLLLILGGIIFAVVLDGGTRLIGRVLPVARGWRLLIVVVLTFVFLLGTIYMTGVEIAAQAGQLRITIEYQANQLIAWATSLGIMPGAEDLNSMMRDALGSIGRVTSFVGSAFGALSSLLLILVIGLFLAIEPGVYDRGFQWMLPVGMRAEAKVTIDRIGLTMRRLMFGRIMGMIFEGALTWLALWLGGVPMALILGILTGILAFIPNIGAALSGVLMVAVGFSAGVETGLWAIATYFVIQTFDGYVLLPYVARRTVDMPPALTLGMQILFGALFGIYGLALADPITAMLKVALERRAEQTPTPSGLTGFGRLGRRSGPERPPG